MQSQSAKIYQNQYPVSRKPLMWPQNLILMENAQYCNE